MVEQRELQRCRGCGKPLAVKQGDLLRVRKNQGRETSEVVIDIHHSKGGVVSISCSDCPHITPHHFFTLIQTAS